MNWCQNKKKRQKQKQHKEAEAATAGNSSNKSTYLSVACLSVREFVYVFVLFSRMNLRVCVHKNIA